jgi:hypothetical protein
MKTIATFVVYIATCTFVSYIVAIMVFAGYSDQNLNPWDMLAITGAAALIFLIGPITGLALAILDTRKRKRKKLRASDDSENPYPPI